MGLFGGGGDTSIPPVQKDPDTKAPDDGDARAARERDIERRKRAGYANTVATTPTGVMTPAGNLTKPTLFGSAR